MRPVFDCFRATNIQSAWQVYGVYIKQTKGTRAAAVLYVRKSMYPHNIFIRPPLAASLWSETPAQFTSFPLHLGACRFYSSDDISLFMAGGINVFSSLWDPCQKCWMKKMEKRERRWGG